MQARRRHGGIQHRAEKDEKRLLSKVLSPLLALHASIEFSIRSSRLSLTGRVLLRWHVRTEYEPGTPGHGFWISIKENGVSLLSTEDCEESEVSETARHEMIQKTLLNLLFLVFEWSVAKL